MVTTMTMNIIQLGRALTKIDKKLNTLKSLSKSLALDEGLKIARRIPRKEWREENDAWNVGYQADVPKFPLVFSLDRKGLEPSEFYCRGEWEAFRKLEKGRYETSLSLYLSIFPTYEFDTDDEPSAALFEELVRWQGDQRIDSLYEKINKMMNKR